MDDAKANEVDPDTLPTGLLDWAEKAGLENLKGRIESGNAIAAQAATTLTVLLAGIGGALAYAVKVFEPKPDPVAHGAAALCIFLALLAVLLICTCLVLRRAPMLYNQPLNLVQAGFSTEQLKYAELRNIELRIKQMTSLNTERARWLNGIRLLAALSPIVFLLAALYYR